MESPLEPRWFLILNIFIAILVVVLHSISLRLMLKLKASNINGSQKYLLMALCCDELALGVITVLHCVMEFLEKDSAIGYIIFLFDLTSLYLINISVTILITLDRLLEFRLNLKYSLYWSPTKTLRLLFSLVFISIFIFVCVVILQEFYEFDFVKICLIFVLPQFFGVFMFLATYTYYLIFKKLKKNRKEDAKLRRIKQAKEVEQRTSLLKKRFRVFLPSWIIATCILFGVVPHIMLIIHYYVAEEKVLEQGAMILYSIGWLADAFLYIFSLKPIRKKIRRLSR